MDDPGSVTLRGAVFEVGFVRRPGSDAKSVWCAMKRPAPHLVDDASARAALVREASFLALANHPAVPKLIEVGSDERGPFVIEERIVGVSLEELLEAHGGAISFHLAAHIVVSLATALDELHALRDDEGPLHLVHGDPSPANLIFGPSGAVRLVDFGASSFRGARSSETRSAGTLPYAAPELCRGEADVSAATDLYAVGAIAIRLFTSAPLAPADGEAQKLIAIAERGIDLSILASAHLPHALRRALAALVAFAPEDRQRSSTDLLRALSASTNEET